MKILLQCLDKNPFRMVLDGALRKRPEKANLFNSLVALVAHKNPLCAVNDDRQVLHGDLG